ncbi:CoA transferase [uncultured Bacteroides sp.]|uniref:CoA transferase n=1 Tax=uncultured Bacteroides sp. TaxID=162156 RepID=UPI0025CB9594|nr:CoA transferase [uncultured Bacteroides sp.]
MKKSELPVFGNLKGIKVVTSGLNYAGPFVGTLLAEQGAETIHIENAAVPDMIRAFSDAWALDHRNGRTIALNVPSEKGKEIFKKLIADADIFVESSKPGSWEKWGLSDDVLWQIKPDLVICHVSGYGQYGDPNYVPRPSFDRIGMAFSGYAMVNGEPDPAPPAFPEPYACDFITAMFATYGVLAALFNAKRTGIGESIDVAQYEAMLRVQSDYVMDGLNYGKQHKRVGAGVGPRAIDPLHRCKDGRWVIISLGGAAMYKRAEALWGLDKDPDFADMHPYIAKEDLRAQRLKDACNKFFEQYEAEEAVDILNAHSITSSICMTYDAMERNSHYQAREAIIGFYDPNKDTMLKGPNAFPKFSKNPSCIFRGGPTYGMDNDDILAELGYTEDEIRQMYSEKVVSQEK